MSVYSVKKKGWRYEIIINGVRFTKAWFRTKAAARRAAAKKREEVMVTQSKVVEQTDMDFLGLVNRRLDYVQAYNSLAHYRDYRHCAKRWVAMWGTLKCSEIRPDAVEKFIMRRKEVSAQTANHDIRYLRALFNFGKKKGYINCDPTQGIGFFPTDGAVAYVPAACDIDKVIACAGRETQDYLWTVRDTLARVNEINMLTWRDVDLQNKYVTLYTKKKKGGIRTPRKVAMTDTLYCILLRRHASRDRDVPWVFWHLHLDRKTGTVGARPYGYRKTLLSVLCDKAKVQYFSFHALRRSGASIMANSNVPITAIQRILGHQKITTTEIYLKSFDETEREAIKNYEKTRREIPHKSHTGKREGPAASANPLIYLVSPVGIEPTTY